MGRIRVGTRGSDLAMIQAGLVAKRLEQAAGVGCELVPIASHADRHPDVALAELGVQGAFVKELQRALLDGLVDVVVHSLKDLPLDEPEGLALAAVCLRERPTDTLITRVAYGRVTGLPPGARVGTGSPRRQAQLRHLRPDLRFVPIRGNIPTRVRKLEKGEVDGVVVATAAIVRLGLAVENAVELSLDEILPAPGQGALAVEVRKDDSRAMAMASALDEPETRLLTEVERRFLRAVGGGCHSSAAAYCRPGPGGVYVLDAGLELDGKFRRTRISFYRAERGLWAAEEAARVLLLPVA